MDLQANRPTCPPRLPSGSTLPTPRSTDGNGPGRHGDGGLDLKTAVSLLPTPRATRGRSATETVALLPTPRASDGTRGVPNQRGSVGYFSLHAAVQAERWGEYAAAVARHEMAIGRAAPNPTHPPRRPAGKPKLSPEFVEWLMMLPAGHVTGVPHLTRAQQLKALGNGVVPAQAAEGIARCLAIVRAGAAGRSAAA